MATATTTLTTTTNGGTSSHEKKTKRLWSFQLLFPEHNWLGAPAGERIQSIAGSIVTNSYFQLFVVLLIVTNAIMMGVATLDFVVNHDDVMSAFETTDTIFLVIFTVELSLHFLHKGIYLFADGWLVFDFIIVLMSWSLESLQIVRSFRIFRALRLITRVKLLKDLVSALFSVGPRMNAIFCLLLLIFYVYGVMCTILFKDLYVDGHTKFDYFSRLDVSMWTLLIIMTLDWGFVSRQVMAVYPSSWAIFVTFVMITSFIAYNLIVAVVCDSVTIIENQNKRDEDEAEEASQMERIRDLRTSVNQLTKQQDQILSILQRTIQKMGVDTEGCNQIKRNERA